MLVFLARMMSFEGLQWGIGLIFYLTQNQIVGIVFEIFAAYEGLFVFISQFGSEIKL